MNEQVRMSPLQKAMCKQMVRSWAAPQFQLETEVNCHKLIEFRNAFDFRPSYTTILTKVVADLLVKHPMLNASLGDDAIILHEKVNIGIATDTKRGLLVPVIQDAANKSLLEIHEAIENIKAKTDRGNFTMEEMSNGTFTISNLGIFNVTSFKAIVNAPQAAILAVSKIREVPIICEGQIVAGKMMTLSLSVDHRVTDGATGARFLSELVTVLENLTV